VKTPQPCQFTPGDSCPWHGEDADYDTRKTLLELDNSIKDVVAGALQAGDTVPEACSEAGISKDQYYDWRSKGLETDEDNIFADFAEEVTQARRVAGKKDRSRLKQLALENGDTRTLYKIHHDQYGDAYGKEDEDARKTGDSVELVVQGDSKQYEPTKQ
jgi:transposase-like protein